MITTLDYNGGSSFITIDITNTSSPRVVHITSLGTYHPEDFDIVGQTAYISTGSTNAIVMINLTDFTLTSYGTPASGGLAVQHGSGDVFILRSSAIEITNVKSGVNYQSGYSLPSGKPMWNIRLHGTDGMYDEYEYE